MRNRLDRSNLIGNFHRIAGVLCSFKAKWSYVIHFSDPLILFRIFLLKIFYFQEFSPSSIKGLTASNFSTNFQEFEPKKTLPGTRKTLHDSTFPFLHNLFNIKTVQNRILFLNTTDTNKLNYITT